MSTEAFRPVRNSRPNSLIAKAGFFGRMLFDLQLLTIYRDLRRRLPDLCGEVLDVGSGDGPYRFLLTAENTTYTQIDFAGADEFDYQNPDVVRFDGQHIPFPDDAFDVVLCTEVLEHVFQYQELVDEIRRVMKIGSIAILTVPWSARFHYIPYDYFRYTPSSLRNIFQEFDDINVTERGTDISVITSKLVVLWFRHLRPSRSVSFMFAPFWIATAPLLLGILLVGHLAMAAGLGSADDPLGYTVVVRK